MTDWLYSPLLANITGPVQQTYHNQTTLHPLGLAAVLVLGSLLVVIQRQRAILPLILIACFVSPAQRVVVATLDFNLLRIMVLFGWARLCLRGEIRSLKLNPLDATLLAWTTVRTLAIFFRNDMGVGALIYGLGRSFDAVGLYFFCRMVIRDRDDVIRAVRDAALVAIPVCIAFVIERITAHNVFAVFGGVAEKTWVRNGRLRCQGAFAHAILAGCFWAGLLPQFVSLWWQGARGLAVAGTVSACTIILCCSSSTPVMAVIFGMIGASLFPFRSLMWLVRWGGFFALVGLHIVMEAPVWHLISRVDVVGGSTGYHRYRLINEFVNHFNEWWLFGVKSTAHWGIVDITNQFVKEGIQGGLLTLVLFSLIVAFSFRGVGKVLRRSATDFSRLIFAWSLGVGIFIHIMNYLAVSYFGQIILIWYLHLAMIGSMATAEDRAVAPAPQATRSRRSPTTTATPLRGSPQVFS